MYKKILMAVLLMSLLGLSASAVLAEGEGISITIELKDGSVIMGTIEESTGLSVKTKYGELIVNPKDIASIIAPSISEQLAAGPEQRDTAAVLTIMKSPLLERLTIELKGEVAGVRDTAAVLTIMKSPLLERLTIELGGEVAEVNEDSLVIKRYNSSFKAKAGPNLWIVRYTQGGEKPEENLKLGDVKVGDDVWMRCFLEKGEWLIDNIQVSE